MRPLPAIRRSPLVTFTFDGLPMQGHDGSSIAVALRLAGVSHLRSAPRDGTERGFFCAMGICQECVVLVNGTPVEACRTAVSAGLSVRRIPAVAPDAH